MIIAPRVWAYDGPADEPYHGASSVEDALRVLEQGHVVVVPSIDMALSVLEAHGSSAEWLDIVKKNLPYNGPYS